MPEETGGIVDEHEFDPEPAEREIAQFIESADTLPAPPVAELAERVSSILADL